MNIMINKQWVSVIVAALYVTKGQLEAELWKDASNQVIKADLSRCKDALEYFTQLDLNQL